MYRIRFHGRGGQGIQTAGRILGTTFLLEGFTEASDGVIQIIANLHAQEDCPDDASLFALASGEGSATQVRLRKANRINHL